MSRAPEMRLISCIGVDIELPLLPHFVRHYRGLGVAPERMHIILNASDPESENLARARRLLEEVGVASPELWIAPYTSGSMWEKRRELQEKVAAPEDWVLNADADEFHEYPAGLRSFLKYCAARDVNVVQGPFVDRLAPDLRLVPVAPEGSIEAQFPVQADVACGVGGVGQHHNYYGTVKMMAHRGSVFPSMGGHHPMKGGPARHLYGKPLGQFRRIGEPAFRFRLPTRVHHYKWTATLLDGLRRRVAIPGASPADIEYSLKLVDYFERNDGCVRREDAPLRGYDGLLPWRLRVAILRNGTRASRRVTSLRRRFA